MSSLKINVFDQFSRYLDYTKEEKDIMPTGWGDLNKQMAYGGLARDSLFYLFAKASVGKTYFVCNWIRRLLTISNNKKILFFSLEMSFENIMDRFLQGILSMSLDEVKTYVRRYDFEDKESDNVIKRLEGVSYFDRVVIYDGRYDLETIRNIVSEEKPDIIFIDHLHRIKTKETDIFPKTTKISGELFNIKKQFQTRIVCLVQLKREGMKDKSVMAGTKLPTIESGKGSGAIEEDGDFIFGLARPDISLDVTGGNKNKIHGAFLKNRFPSGAKRVGIAWEYNPATSILGEEYA